MSAASTQTIAILTAVLSKRRPRDVTGVSFNQTPDSLELTAREAGFSSGISSDESQAEPTI